MRLRRLCVSALLLGMVTAAAAQGKGKVLHVAAAADLTPVMPALAAAYEKETGTKLEVSFGSSSVLATQIINGAPMDVFMGADFTFPEKVIAANLAEEKLPVPYAKGTLVLWSRRNLAAPLSMELMSDPRVTKIAIADQFHAPYGRAAYEELTALKLYDKLKPKLVVGENIGQTAEFVESGNAQMGLISLTLAMSDKLKADGQFVRLPAMYAEIQQCAVVIKASKNLDEAKAFLDWLRGPRVQAALGQFGLEPVR